MPSGWTVGNPVSSGRYTDTARSASAGTVRSTGSLTTIVPGGTTVDGRPPNVSARSEAGTIAAPFARSAMCAAPTFSVGFSSAFASDTRTRLPPRLACAIMRTV